MLFLLLQLIAGLILLMFAGDLLVRGAVALAQKFAIPQLVIGLTIVAFGTSAPELMISVTAALDGAAGLALGNVVGSNIANILLVLGIPSLIAATQCGGSGQHQASLLMLGFTGLFVALCFTGPLVIWHGIVLVGALCLFLWLQYRQATLPEGQSEAGLLVSDMEDVEGVPHSNVKMVLFLIGGLVGLPLAAHFTVEGAVGLALLWGISETFIGLTIVAFGTSLPELATTFMAALRNHGGVGIGNVVGSNIFNLLAIIGITSLVAPIPIDQSILAFDLWVMVGTTLFLSFLIWRQYTIGKLWGAGMILIYGLYVYATYLISGSLAG
jgi:cation:H+ antiporter